MDIRLFAARTCNKVNLSRYLDGTVFAVVFGRVYDADVYTAFTNDQFVVDDIFHDMGEFLLAESDPRGSEPYVFAIVFVGIIKVVFPFHVKTLTFAEKECVYQVVEIRFDGIV